MEIDLLLVNGDALVVVEVKSTLRVDDVRTLVKDLKRFPEFCPEYRDYRLFGRSPPSPSMSLRTDMPIAKGCSC